MDYGVRHVQEMANILKRLLIDGKCQCNFMLHINVRYRMTRSLWTMEQDK